MITVLVATAGLCPPIGGCAALEGLGGSLAGDATSSVFSALSSWLASGGVALVDHVLGLLTTTTPILPTGSASSGPSWFTKEEDFMLGLMGLVILPMLLVATLGAIARQDLSRLGRTWLVALPVSIVSALVGVEITRGALQLTDSLSGAVLSTVNVPLLLGKALGAIALNNAGNIAGGSVAILFIAILAIVAGILLWLELVVRSAAIYVALLFLPLALSGLVWPSTSHMARRLVQVLVALIVSKFVVAAVLALGAGAVEGSGGEGALAGVAVLLLAGFAPFTLLRMVPIVEAGAMAHLEGLSRRPFHGGRQSVSLAATGVGMIPEPIRSALGFQAGGANPSVGASPVEASLLRQQHGEYPASRADIGRSHGQVVGESGGPGEPPVSNHGSDSWGGPPPAGPHIPEDRPVPALGRPPRQPGTAQGEDR